MALEMQNFEALSPPVVKKITWWTLVYTVPATSVATKPNLCTKQPIFNELV